MLMSLLVSILFLEITVSAQSYNLNFELISTDNVWRYDLMQNARDLSLQEKQNRFIYRTNKLRYANEMLSLGLSKEQILCYLLPNFQTLLSEIRQKTETRKKESQIIFTPNSEQLFTYVLGQDEKLVNVDKLFDEILSNKQTINVPLIIDKAETLNQLKAKTQMRSSFETVFSPNKTSRVHNMKRASEFFNGKIVEVNEVVSFNETVGERTSKNGFQMAKVIENGVYVDGMGGGVCQVSTTLYNALLLADVQISRVSPHSLLPSYVKPSFDAMVSYGSSDLVFCNTTGSRLYICAYVQHDKLIVKIFGAENIYQIERESIVEKIPFDVLTQINTDKTDESLRYEDQRKIIVYGQNGAKSEGYLVYYLNGKEQKRVRIRKNTYKKIDQIEIIGYEKR